MFGTRAASNSRASVGCRNELCDHRGIHGDPLEDRQPISLKEVYAPRASIVSGSSRCTRQMRPRPLMPIYASGMSGRTGQSADGAGRPCRRQRQTRCCYSRGWSCPDRGERRHSSDHFVKGMLKVAGSSDLPRWCRWAIGMGRKQPEMHWHAQPYPDGSPIKASSFSKQKAA